MKYNKKTRKNQRIEELTATTLITGVDISKEKHFARATDFRGIELGKRCIFENNRQGLTILLAWMKQLQINHGKDKIVLGIEPTGHYWFCMAEFLRQHGVRVVLVNPDHVKKSKEFEDNSPTKNDHKDAILIADLVKNGKYTEPIAPKSIYADLRILMNHRDRLNVNRNQVKNRIHNWLDRFFPEYLQVFKSWEGKTSLITLKEFPLPEEIIAMGNNKILLRWKQEVKRAVGKNRIEKLSKYAAESIGLKEGAMAAKIELKTLLEQYQLYTRQLEDVTLEAEHILYRIPGVEEMLSIPCVGIVTLAGFLAEVGDLNNYQHGQQLIRLAGLNLKENSSGKHKGQAGISKRGRKRLRALLFRCVLVMVCKNAEFKALHKYYTTRKQNPLKKKQSIIALCGKLARIMHTLGTRRIKYEPQAMLGPARLAQLRLVA